MVTGMIRRLARWVRYRRYLRAEVGRRQYLGYGVSRARYEELRGQARERAGYQARRHGAS